MATYVHLRLIYHDHLYFKIVHGLNDIYGSCRNPSSQQWDWLKMGFRSIYWHTCVVSLVPPSAAAMFTFCGDVVLKRKVLCRLKKKKILISVKISLPLNNTDDICYTFDPLMWILFYVADENIQDSLIKGLSDIRCLFHLFRWRWTFNNYFKDFVSNPFLNNAVYIIWDTRTN